MTEIKVGSKWIDGRGSIFTVVSVSKDYVNFSDFSGYPHTLLKENWPGSMRWFGDAPVTSRLSPEETEMTEIKVGSKWMDGLRNILVVTAVDSHVHCKHPNGRTYSLLRKDWLIAMHLVEDAPRLSPEESGVLLAAIEALSELEKMRKGYDYNERVSLLIQKIGEYVNSIRPTDPAKAREDRVAAAMEATGTSLPESYVRELARAAIAAYEEPGK